MRLLPLILGALLSGCDDPPPPPEPSATASSSTSTASTTAPPQASVVLPPAVGSALSAADAVRLLSSGERLKVVVDRPGEEPRKVLRHEPAIGEQATLSLEANVVSIVERKTIHASYAYTIDARVSARPENDIALSIRIVKAAPITTTRDGAEVAAKLVGQESTLRFDQRGGLVNAPFPDVDADAKQLWASVAEAMRDAVAPLPEAAVGHGAQWRAIDRVWRGGAMLLRTCHVQLDAGSKDSADDALRIKATVSEQPVSEGPRDPALPENLAVQALAGMGAGARRVAWRPGTLLPLAADSQIASDLRIEVRYLDMPDAGLGTTAVDTVRLTQVLTLLKEP